MNTHLISFTFCVCMCVVCISISDTRELCVFGCVLRTVCRNANDIRSGHSITRMQFSHTTTYQLFINRARNEYICPPCVCICVTCLRQAGIHVWWAPGLLFICGNYSCLLSFESGPEITLLIPIENCIRKRTCKRCTKWLNDLHFYKQWMINCVTFDLNIIIFAIRQCEQYNKLYACDSGEPRAWRSGLLACVFIFHSIEIRPFGALSDRAHSSLGGPVAVGSRE